MVKLSDYTPITYLLSTSLAGPALANAGPDWKHFCVASFRAGVSKCGTGLETLLQGPT